MKKGMLVLLLLLATQSNAANQQLTACKSTYALCTTAKCLPIPGKKGWVNCPCDVKNGYSAGTKICQQEKISPKGTVIYSRYFPLKSYAICNNNRPWAACLDSTCVIDKNNPKKANCLCSLVSNQGSYVIAADSYKNNLCEKDIYSSATVVQSNQITNFLKTQPKLQPFPIKIVTP